MTVSFNRYLNACNIIDHAMTSFFLPEKGEHSIHKERCVRGYCFHWFVNEADSSLGCSFQVMSLERKENRELFVV